MTSKRLAQAEEKRVQAEGVRLCSRGDGIARRELARSRSYTKAYAHAQDSIATTPGQTFWVEPA